MVEHLGVAPSLGEDPQEPSEGPRVLEQPLAGQPCGDQRERRLQGIGMVPVPQAQVASERLVVHPDLTLPGPLGEHRGQDLQRTVDPVAPVRDDLPEFLAGDRHAEQGDDVRDDIGFGTEGLVEVGVVVLQ
ncbi:hypothetical protein IX27_19575 [Streptomyces sp. JS01]|nr:hypothetical protein IX27_19575 [Streptomyces sp. JS01]